MERKVNTDDIYRPSDDVVARIVSEEFIIIPITSGGGDSDDSIFSLNKYGQAIWNRLSGKRSLKDVVSDLCGEFEASIEEIEEDVLGLVGELLKRKMVTRV
jgi:hypothetical protein